MILALLGKEFDGADKTLPGLQRFAQGEVVERAIERRRFAAELSRRVRVGVGDQPVAVEHRQPPVHRRVGREPGLHGKDLIGQIAVACGDRIKAGLRAERGEPRRPDMRRDEIGVGTGRQRDLEKVARVEPEDRAAVGSDVADARQALGNALGGREVRRVDEMVHLPCLPGLLVDRGNFHLEHEAHRRRGTPAAVPRRPLARSRVADETGPARPAPVSPCARRATPDG